MPDASFNVLQGDQMTKLTTAQIFDGKKVSSILSVIVTSDDLLKRLFSLLFLEVSSYLLLLLLLLL